MQYELGKSVVQGQSSGVNVVLNAIASEVPRQHDMLGETALLLKHGGPHEDIAHNLECWAMAFKLLAERNYCCRIGPMWKFKRPFRREDVRPLLEWSGVVRAFERMGETR